MDATYISKVCCVLQVGHRDLLPCLTEFLKMVKIYSKNWNFNWLTFPNIWNFTYQYLSFLPLPWLCTDQWISRIFLWLSIPTYPDLWSRSHLEVNGKTWAWNWFQPIAMKHFLILSLFMCQSDFVGYISYDHSCDNSSSKLIDHSKSWHIIRDLQAI